MQTAEQQHDNYLRRKAKDYAGILRKNRESYQRNRETALARQREYYRANRERVNARVKDYHKRRPEILKKAQSAFALKHPEKRELYWRRSAQKNKVKRKQAVLKHYHLNRLSILEKRFKERVENRERFRNYDRAW